MQTEPLYKWLREDGRAPISRGSWIKGEWLTVKGKLVACENGLHLAQRKNLVDHISDRLWIAEADLSGVVDAGDKLVVRRARVVERVETITEWTLRALAADCADRVVHLTGPDPRSVEAIRVARLFARQKATPAELAAAGDAARVATRDAAGAAAGAATRDAAGAAAWDAAGAAGAAAWDAGAAAWDAAWDAAGAAANARLLQYVDHGLDAMDMPWPAQPAWPVIEAIPSVEVA